MQGNGHVVLHIGVGILGVVDAGDGGVPAIQLSGYFDTGGRFFAALAATGEHIGREILAADSVQQTVFQGITTANCCVTVDFAALNPGVPAGPSKWMTTRYALVFVQMWVMRSAKSTALGPATVPLSSWLL